MNKLKIVSIDLAKNVFQVCGISTRNKIVFNKQLKRKDLATFIAKLEPTLIAMEACYSSHYWARCFRDMGHSISLLPAQHVAPFVRGNKSDYNDAMAIAEAAQRPCIITVPIKSIEQQDIQSLHRIRERYIANRTSLMNQARGLLSEYGIVSPKGHRAFCSLVHDITQTKNTTLSPELKRYFNDMIDEYLTLSDRINDISSSLNHIANQNSLCQLLLSIPGIGYINATAIYSAIARGQQFSNARDFAVWLGLTPKQYSSGDSSKSSGITKRGNRYLRKQLVHGARAVLFRCRNKEDKLSLWANQLIARRGIQKATVAMAARIARLAWILLNKNEPYKVMP